jgi:hypothetical protein
MNCKTGCGREAEAHSAFCYACGTLWAAAPENDRRCAQARLGLGGDQAFDRALVDFCNRVRAERQNTKPEGT